MLSERMNEAIAFTRRYVRGDFLNNPRTIQEKIAYIKTIGVTPEMTMCADKLLVKEYARKKLGTDVCVPTIKVYGSPDDIDPGELPDSFALKCNHGCQYNVIVKDKSSLDLEDAKNRLRGWLSIDFSTRGGEMQYHGIDRKCFAEKYVGGADGIKDYKFLCFNGRPTFCQIISDRGTPLQRLNYYDMDFRFVDLCRLDFPNNPELLDDRPYGFERMKDYARALSSDFDFVRVDFFENDGRVYLGEMTFTPGNARMKYEGDPETSAYVGSLLRITR